MQRLITLLSLLLLGGSALGQSIITGSVRTIAGAPVEHARVLALSPRDSTILSYAFTDARGAYRLSVRSPLPQLLLSASSMEIEKTTVRIENRSQAYHFRVRESQIILQEVHVKARKMWGKDTINYSVAGFADRHDVVIADVLKKMPGIEVSPSGMISYNGKAINKFYIEGLDALQGRYGIATNNIPAKDVATVQVLENHQPIKALETARLSDKAAINLKLKESVKGTFSATAHLGLGYDTRLRRNEELTGMYFARKRQHIYTLKSNDNGHSVRGELSSFYTSSALPGLSMTSLSHAPSPSFRTERHYRNDTHALTANNLFKLKNDAELNANLIFLHDRERGHGGSRTIYHLGTEAQVIEEDVQSHLRTNELEADLRYNVNKDKSYFNNLLHLEAEWGDESASVYTGATIGQTLRRRRLGAENSTHWIRRGAGGRGFELFWRTGVATQPHRLGVAPGPYADRLNAGTPYRELIQDVRHRVFASNLQLSLLSSLRLWGIGLSPTLLLQARHHALDTELGAVPLAGSYSPLPQADMHNGISYTRLSAGIGQELSYKGDRLRLGGTLLLFYLYTHMGDRLRPTETLGEGRLQFIPSLWMTYEATSRLELKLSGSMGESLPELPSLYTGYILSGYRSLNRNQMKLFARRHQQAGLNLNYKDVFSLFFLGGGVSYSRYSSDAISSLVFDGPLRLTERLHLPHSGQSLSVNARVSKGYDWMSMTLSAEGHAGRGSGQSLIQRVLRGYENEWVGLSGKLNITPIRLLTLGYNLSWSLYRSRTEGQEWLAPVKSLNHSATLHINLSKHLALKLVGEHYYNSAVTEGRHFTLADAGLTYTLGKARLTLDWTNIFGTQTYTSASVGDLISTYSYYYLRPSAVMLRVRFKLF